MKLKVTINDEEVEITLTKDQIAQIQKPKAVFWEPEENDLAYFVDNRNSKEVSSHYWGGTSTYKHLITTGSAFKTKEEAQAELAFRKARYALRKRIFGLNGGVEQPFKNGGSNHLVILNADSGLVSDWCVSTQMRPNWFFLASNKLCKQLIKEMPEELKTYIKG